MKAIQLINTGSHDNPAYGITVIIIIFTILCKRLEGLSHCCEEGKL